MAAEQIFNIKLVKEIEKHPCLYNFNLPEYMRKDKTEKRWEEIGNKVGLSGPECKEKWKNLRSVFVRHLRPSKTGAAIKKPYYLAEFMQFAIPFIKMPIKTSDKIQKMSFSTEDILPDNTQENSSDNEALYLPQSQTTLESECNEPSNITIKKRKHEEPEIELQESSYFSVNQTKMFENNEDTEAEYTSNKMFLLSMLPDMNKMNDKQRRVFKRRILDLADDLLTEDERAYTDTPNIHSRLTFVSNPSPMRSMKQEYSESN